MTICDVDFTAEREGTILSTRSNLVFGRKQYNCVMCGDTIEIQELHLCEKLSVAYPPSVTSYFYRFCPWCSNAFSVAHGDDGIKVMTQAHYDDSISPDEVMENSLEPVDVEEFLKKHHDYQQGFARRFPITAEAIVKMAVAMGT